MANLKEIRKRIISVKNTQKITRAMKMVAGARLHRAQSRIQALRPYALQTAEVLRAMVDETLRAGANESGADEALALPVAHPLLARREEKKILILAITSDRGLCGGFNTNILRRAERLWHEAEAEGKEVQIFTVGRKGRDYLKRRKAPLVEHFSGLWDDLGLGQARRVARGILTPFLREDVDAIYVVYNEFKSAMTQMVVAQPLFPLSGDAFHSNERESQAPLQKVEYMFEPNREQLLEVLVPMYTEVTLLRVLYESMASELGARMTAMDSATKNARDMISALTLQYNRARQAAITTELMEIIGGAEALNS